MEAAGWTGVYRQGRDLYTRNAVPGHRVYGEALVTSGEAEYRQWDPWHSKLAAMFLKGRPSPLLDNVSSVLYLGGAHGTTVSHLSDALPGATIFVIEKSPVSFAPLLALSRERSNLIPILADAQLPERYAADVGPVDLLYQDVAQRNQARIFLDNAESCLAPEGRGLLMLKVRSVTQSKPPTVVLNEARRELSAGGFSVRQSVELQPFARDHHALFLTR